jgi:hypothetical protein
MPPHVRPDTGRTGRDAVPGLLVVPALPLRYSCRSACSAPLSAADGWCSPRLLDVALRDTHSTAAAVSGRGASAGLQAARHGGSFARGVCLCRRGAALGRPVSTGLTHVPTPRERDGVWGDRPVHVTVEGGGAATATVYATHPAGCSALCCVGVSPAVHPSQAERQVACSGACSGFPRPTHHAGALASTVRNDVGWFTVWKALRASTCQTHVGRTARCVVRGTAHKQRAVCNRSPSRVHRVRDVRRPRRAPPRPRPLSLFTLACVVVGRVVGPARTDRLRMHRGPSPPPRASTKPSG